MPIFIFLQLCCCFYRRRYGRRTGRNSRRDVSTLPGTPGVCRLGGKKYKKCPSCKVQIEKNGGCNRMTCRCGQMFCWICGTKVTGYGHYENGCILFVEHRYGNYLPATFHDGYVAYRAALIRNENAKQQKCPRCRNKSVKSGRLNLIKCWFCKGHFCIQCGCDLTKLSQPSTHYHTSKSCTQHSDE